VKFYITLALFTVALFSFGQVDDKLVLKFFQLKNDGKYSEAMEYYNQVEQFTTSNFNADTNELNFRFVLFDLAIKVDSIELAELNAKKIEILSDKLILGTRKYSILLYGIHLMHKQEKNHSESIRVLNKIISNQLHVNSKDPKLGEYLDEIAYAYYCSRDYQNSIEYYEQSIPLIKSHYSRDYYISSLDLYARALYELKQYNQLISHVEECIAYYQERLTLKTNQQSLLINLYHLAKALNFLNQKQAADDTYKVFFDKSIQYVEVSSLSEFSDGIYEQRLINSSNQNSIYNLSKQLEYYTVLDKFKPGTIENIYFLSSYFHLASSYSSYNETKPNGERYFQRLDINKAIEVANVGITFAKECKLTDHYYYKDLQFKRLELLLELNQIEAFKRDLRKLEKYLNNVYPNSILDHLKLDFINYQGMQRQNLLAKANLGFIKLHEEFIEHLEWLDSTDFLLLYGPVLSEIEHYYYSIENFEQSKTYQLLKDKINYQIDLNLNVSAERLGLNYSSSRNNLSYSDSLLDLMNDSIIPYFSSHLLLKSPIDKIISNLELDLNRTDLNVYEKLETLMALSHIYLKLERHVFLKNTILKEKILRDEHNLWNDSIYVQWNISYAHVLNELYETNESIIILSKLKNEDISINRESYLRLINNLSFYLGNLGEFQKSKDLREEYLSFFSDSVRLKNDPNYLEDYILGLENYGELCISMNDYKNSYKSLKLAYELSGKYLWKLSDSYYGTLMNYADFMRGTDKIEIAQQLLLEYKELSLKKFGQLSIEYFQSINELLVFYSENDRLSDADSLFHHVTSTFKKVFFSNGIGLNSKEYKNYTIQFYKEFNLWLEYALVRYKERPDFLEEMINSYFLLFDLDVNRENLSSKLWDPLQHTEYRAKLAQYHYNLQLPLQQLLEKKINLSNNKRTLDSLENVLYSSTPSFTETETNFVSEISQSLLSSQAFMFCIEHHPIKQIRYFLDSDSLVKTDGTLENIVFVISNNKANPIEFDIYGDTILRTDVFKEYYQYATREKSSQYKSNAQLFTNLIGNTVERLKNKTQIFVYPSVFLNWSNLDLLVTGPKNDFLIETHEVVYVKSIKNINNDLKDVKFKNATLIGNPNYNSTIDYLNFEEPIGGIGVKWSPLAFLDTPKFIFESLVPNYPAVNAGLLPGDTLIKVNGFSVESANDISQVNDRLKGLAGSKVSITIGGSRGRRDIELVRKDLSLQELMTPFDKLPYTNDEVNKIEYILKNKLGVEVENFTSDFATEERVKSISHSDIIHLATHSFFVNRDKDIVKYDYTPINGVYAKNYYGNTFFDNGLVFSGVNNFKLDNYNGSKENGILYSCEIGNLVWDETDLVVLSSCESGLGLNGVYSSSSGLISALQKAGVKNVIASLWKVNDKVTQEFMVEFYNNLAAHKTISSSLRSAKLAIKKIHPEPYYWAPFVLYSLN
jgi:CHAT domain-containing protein